MYFADIHCHALAGVDDGAPDDKTMYEMIDAAFRDGVRLLCFTPHWNPSVFGDNRASVSNAFAKASEYVVSKRIGMRLFLANELRADRGDLSWLSERLCRTLHGRCVLVDFPTRESVKNISDGVYRLLSAGYKPILAHAERYESLGFSVEPLKNLRADGALIQMNAGSPLGSFGFMCALRAKAMLKERVADIAASDAHDLSDRPTEMSAGYAFVEKKYGREYAASLFCACPESIFKNKGE